MKYLQSSFTIERPAQVTCCEGCVYGAEAHAQFCERTRPLCWMCRDGSTEAHVHFLAEDGGYVIPADPDPTRATLQCDVCGFVAKNEDSLMMHDLDHAYSNQLGD